ncbi:MAG: T9SS type A sorting domain-containing protein [Bacteroidales bacterium]|nr:T9SS type A sorting domain-containing protein [Bacteroidales bacterium]
MKINIAILSILIITIKAGYSQKSNCFLDFTEPKNAVIPDYETVEIPANSAEVNIKIDFSDTLAKVSKYIYGTNANQYTGNYNNETKLINYIKLLSPNIIRYPGGLHSNEYFWSTGYDWSTGYINLPEDIPDLLMNSNGSTYEPFWVPGGGYWTFGLDDFYSFIEKTGCEALITVNYSYARYGTGPTPVQTAAKLAADWVRYDNGRTKYWEIGNENCASWASGYRIDLSLNQDGQPEIITPKLYGEHVKIFIDSMKKAAAEIGHTIYIGSQNDEGVLEGAGNSPDWMVDHTYFTPYQQNSNISTILNSVPAEAKKYADKTIAQTEKYGTDQKPVTMTEWNIFAEGSGQSSSYINGIHAVQVMGELIKNQYGMANRWDIANGWDNQNKGDDMGMFSTGNDLDGSAYKWNPYASFLYMYYFQKFFGDHMVKVTSIENDNDIEAFASRFNSGESSIVLINKSSIEKTVRIFPQNFKVGNRYYYYTLTGGTDNGDFSFQVFVNGNGPSTQLGGPIESIETIKANSVLIDDQIKINLPALSVHFVLLDDGDKILDKPVDMIADKINIFPNPTKGNVIVSGIENIQEINILSIDGRVIDDYSLPLGTNSIKISLNQKPGIYFIQCIGAYQSISRKIITF